EYEGIIITIRERINQDLWDGAAILQKLDPEPPETYIRRDQFLRMVLQTVSTEGLPFKWVTFASSRDDVQAAYVAWCQMSPKLGTLWSNAIYDLNNTVVDTALAPKAEGE